MTCDAYADHTCNGCFKSSEFTIQVKQKTLKALKAFTKTFAGGAVTYGLRGPGAMM